jgi:hypothetical protein
LAQRWQQLGPVLDALMQENGGDNYSNGGPDERGVIADGAKAVSLQV